MSPLSTSRLAPLLGAALLLGTPAAASAQIWGDRDAPALSDAELADVYGAGLSRTTSLQRATRDEFEGFNRLTAQTLPVTFDNWFNDVGTPLIVQNLSR